MSSESGDRTECCIRCDDEISVTVDHFPEDYRELTFDHEASALPICPDCFEEVRDRDIR